jgi:hypothetical protein
LFFVFSPFSFGSPFVGEVFAQHLCQHECWKSRIGAMYINLKWITNFFYVRASRTPNNIQPNSSKIASILRLMHLLLLLLACVFFAWHHGLMKLICESMVYFHEEDDILNDCGHQSFKRITLFPIWNPYTPLLPCYSCLLFLHFIFFYLKFYFNLQIQIVDYLMHLQWPFICKNKIHQGKCSTNNWWMVCTRSEIFKKDEIQWVWSLTVKKSLHLSLLCTNIPMV